MDLRETIISLLRDELPVEYTEDANVVQLEGMADLAKVAEAILAIPEIRDALAT